MAACPPLLRICLVAKIVDAAINKSYHTSDASMLVISHPLNVQRANYTNTHTVHLLSHCNCHCLLLSMRAFYSSLLFVIIYNSEIIMIMNECVYYCRYNILAIVGVGCCYCAGVWVHKCQWVECNARLIVCKLQFFTRAEWTNVWLYICNYRMQRLR